MLHRTENQDVNTSGFSEGEGYEEDEVIDAEIEDDEAEDDEDDNTAVRQAWGEL